MLEFHHLRTRTTTERQAERLVQYATAKGYRITKIVKEVGSGHNDNRKKRENLLESSGYDILIVEHKDRLARFGTPGSGRFAVGDVVSN